MTLTAEQYMALGYDEESALQEAAYAARTAANSPEVDPEGIDAQIAAVEAAVASRVCTLSGRWGCTLPAGHTGDCVKTCVNHFWKRLGEGTEMCPIEPAYVKFGHLCGPCFGRLKGRLRELVTILPHIRSMVTPSLGAGDGPRVSGTKEQPLPMNATAVEDSHDLFERVNEWMAQFNESLGLGVSLATLTWMRRSGDSIPVAWADEYGSKLAMLDIATWYETHELTIVSALPPLTVKAWWDDLDDMTRQYRARYKLTDGRQRVPIAPACTECGEREVEVRADGGRLIDVRCRHCETVFNAREHKAIFDAAERAVTLVISLQCDQGHHKQCRWVDCPCGCHEKSVAA
ncbi:hypothetical protein SCB71_06395 [Herbiconiux sp. KACC 21604]|uniref:hypothetical protein n=1 Tax=unclassified Herbiconiux TaxID=2618217 RepID=UPI0014912835|nr:hypothetical protein [Herbiconiux sp. SALV-R1]QJU52946.1 hypothetical protein HL652_04380 [Herbiconiux sp. SALV-R1]WPO87868.1 hypothetical protein SCB71_06395 [Herbiconiux sp. KACC 21604]